MSFINQSDRKKKRCERPRWVLRLCLLSLCLMLMSCAGTSKKKPKELGIKAVEGVNTELPSLSENINRVDIDYLATDAVQWWHEFNDDTLHQLIDVALINSHDLALTIARLDEVVAAAGAARLARYPTVTFDSRFEASGADIEENVSNSASAVFTVNWQSDLFGELRNISEGAKIRIEAQESLVRDSQRLLISQLVRNYYGLVSIRERQRLARLSVETRRGNLENINQLLQQGYATSLDNTRTSSQLYDAQATLAQLELDEITQLNQLAILAGIDLLSLRDMLSHTASLPEPKAKIPLPSLAVLLKHRPDMRVVERELVAAAYNVNSSIAALYPTLGFEASFGKGADGDLTRSLPTLNVLTGSVLANLAMPILNRGRLLAQVDQNSARLKQAHITFEQTALRAIAQIDTSITSIDKNRIIYEQRSLASETSNKASELSKELFKAGELDYISVIVAEQTRFNDENNAVFAKQAYLNAYIDYLSAVAPVW